ncbi:hypothetical protein HPULCUR_005581 [Helicostylum pulchrum]|uniref:Uncharacterized protein n=1 Tax=Helicostylum pulchrum TaxID=562976 RepID=A0ABP9XZK7_9FUNG
MMNVMSCDVSKKPIVIGINPEFKLTSEQCKRRRIDPMLSGLKAKYWSNPLKLVMAALKTIDNTVSVEVFTRRVQSFFTRMASSFATDIGLSKYSKACKDYFFDSKNKSDLQTIYLAKLQEKEMEFLDEETDKKVYTLRSRANTQKKIAAAAKEYLSAKFEADSLLKSLELESISSSQESTSSEDPVEPNQTDIIDVDHVFTKYNQTDSIGKRIKHEAVILHDQYIEHEITPAEKFVMEVGLSSVLDLSYPEDNHQGYLFSKEELKDLNDYFYRRFKLEETPKIPSMAVAHFESLTSMALEKGFFIALKYISKIQSLESTGEVLFNYLEIFRHVLIVLGEEKHLISAIVTNKKSIFEQDVYSIWFPIIKKLVCIGKIIRMKQGETVNSYTSKRKQDAYLNYEKVSGFKIDIRLLLDYEKYETDLCAGEVAIHSNDADKLTHDRSKCLREAKEIVDHHLEAGMKENVVGWTLQIAGLEACLMSVHLYREGLYVAITQKKLRFPQTVDELSGFMETLEGLEYLIITRPSYYTPPSDTRSASVLPLQLFGHRKHQLFHERIVIRYYDQEPEPLEKMGAEDMFGWANMSDGSWHNSVTGEKKDTSPYEYN